MVCWLNSHSAFLLGLVVVLLPLLKDCYAFRDAQGMKKLEVAEGQRENAVTVAPTTNDFLSKREISVPGSKFGEVPPQHGRGDLGGRKIMMDNKRHQRKEMKLKEGTRSHEASKISGSKDGAKLSKKPPVDSLEGYEHDQRDESNQEQHLLNISTSEPVAKQQDDTTKSGQLCSRGCVADSNVWDRLGTATLKSSALEKSKPPSSQTLESEKLLEAANQMVSLLNKDYTGKGNGHHRSPINNHEPIH